MARRKKQPPHRSKAQWRWAFATKRPWARRWARQNKRKRPYKTLPRYVAGSKYRGTGRTRRRR